MRRSIAVAGSILVDKINEIKAYPKEGELAQILNVSKAVGGCVPNVAIDLKRIDDNVSVKAIGRVGKDDDGEYVLSVLSQNCVDTSDIKKADEPTSFTEVMSVKGGQRTFFTYAGASAEFCYQDIDFDNLDVDALHLGYFLLLDKIDGGDGLRILKKAQSKGIKTSIDLVSENSDRYGLVVPCLPYVDNLIINETEAGAITKINPTKENLVEIAKRLKQMGVKERIIIHTPDISVGLSNNGEIVLPSFELPNGFIKGTTGAGDAFCAGALYGIITRQTDMEILQTASVCATCSLMQKDAVSGLKDVQSMKEMCNELKRKGICL